MEGSGTIERHKTIGKYFCELRIRMAEPFPNEGTRRPIVIFTMNHTLEKGIHSSPQYIGIDVECCKGMSEHL
jgi:hypothetical protein